MSLTADHKPDLPAEKVGNLSLFSFCFITNFPFRHELKLRVAVFLQLSMMMVLMVHLEFGWVTWMYLG